MVCRRSSRSVNELQFFSLLYTISSSCAQRSSFALPQAIGVFMLKPSRSFFSLVRCELVKWMFSWLVFSILSFCVGVFLTGVQHLKLYSISRRNILKDNLTILHKSSSGHNRIRWCWNGLVEVTTKFGRYVIKMWIQNDVIQKHQYFSFIFNITPQSNDKWCTFSFSFLVIKSDFGKRCGSYLSNVPWYSYIPFWFKPPSYWCL